MTGNAKTLDEELYRALKDKFNYVEPSIIAEVTRVYSSTADVKIIQGENSIILRNTPCLRPVYGSGDLNISIGDRVMLIFEKGSIGSAYIIGKLGD